MGQKIRKNKYNAKKVVDDGITFDSQAEHRRYCELKWLLKAGQISHLGVHPRHDLIDCKYEADFIYREGDKVVVEDVKSPATRTPLFNLKAKMFQRLFPNIEFRIVEMKPIKKNGRRRYYGRKNKPKCT